MAKLKNACGWIAFTLLILGGINAETPCDINSKSKTIANQEECLSQVTTEALAVNLSPVSQNDTLSVYIDLLYCSKNAEYIVCCERMCAPGAALRINPLDPITTLENYQLRNKPRISFYPPEIEGERFALMLLDLTNNWIHWLRMDMDELDASSGREVVNYFCPAVGPITFMMLLYRQGIAYDGNLCTVAGSKRSSTKPLQPFCTDECRCILGNDPSALTDLYDMTLVGATWFSLGEHESTTYFVKLRYEGLTLPWDSSFACNATNQLTPQGDCPVPAKVDPLCNFPEQDLDECTECNGELTKSAAMGHSLYLGWYIVILCATILSPIFGHIM